LGSTHDRGLKPHRWERWRPTVDLCRHQDLVIDELVLLYRPSQARLLRVIEADIAQVSPETRVQLVVLSGTESSNLGVVYQDLLQFAGTYAFEPEKVDYYVHTTPGSQIEQLCLLKLTESRHLPAQLLQSQGPQDEGYGHPGSWQTLTLDPSELTQRPTAAETTHRDLASDLRGGIVTKNEQYNQTVERLAKVSLATDEPIFLVGPMGVGKSDLARRVYLEKKKRRKVTGPFIEIDCATIPEARAHEELFGAAGVFAEHAHGLVYLDDLGSLSLANQALLLRSIEQGEFRASDNRTNIPFDVQLIVGARTDLRESVHRGTFREDLWLRIASWQFDFVPLTERRADISPNIDHALREHMKRAGRRVEFNPEARASFEAFACAPSATWNGNFRDLNAAVTRMATFAELGKITRDLVREEMKRLKYMWAGPTQVSLNLSAVVKPELLETIDRFELVQLSDVLSVCSESRNLSEAGRTLFSESRKRKARPNDADRLRKYLAKYDLEWARLPHTSGR